jgi:hypothetical protein
VCAAAPEHVFPAAPPPAHWREPPPRSSPAPDHVFPSSICCVPLLHLLCSPPPPESRRRGPRLLCPPRRVAAVRAPRAAWPAHLNGPEPADSSSLACRGGEESRGFGERGWRCRARMSPTVLSHTLLRGGEGLNDFTSREENGGNASSLMPQTRSVGLFVSDLIKLHCCSQSSG